MREIIAEHRPRAGDGLNFHVFDAAEDDMAEFVAAVAGGGLFAVKKLIALERPFTAPRQFDIVKSALADTHKKSDVLLVVWDEAPDAEGRKRLKEVEKDLDKTQEYPLLSGAPLQRWIRREAARRGIALSAADAAALATRGPDLWRVANEMEKIAVGGSAERTRAAPTFFDLGDTFFSSPRVARHILLSLLHGGAEEMRLFAYLAGRARTLLIAKSYRERGVAAPASPNIKPSVVQKASRQVGTLSVTDLAHILRRFLDEDRKIKTGASTGRESLLRLLNA